LYESVFFSFSPFFVTQDCSHKQHRAKRFLGWMNVFNAGLNDGTMMAGMEDFSNMTSHPPPLPPPLSTYSNPSAFLSQSNLCKPSTPFIYGVFSDENNYYFVQKSKDCISIIRREFFPHANFVTFNPFSECCGST
jgi:hypothetical protein